MINVYVVKLDKYSRKVSEQASELQQLHQKSGKDDAELEKLNSSLKASEAEVEKQKSTVYRQGMELGELRKKAKDFKNPNGGSIIDGVILQDTAKKKKFKLIATIGYINPIASGFSTLKQDLEEHKWEPFVKSLFTELEEAVRRNDWEEICVVHDRMHSFAEAFDNDLRERIEKAELEIIRQCEEGVERLLGAMM
ncbi:hypothetical protein N431DRAFT_338685 [Stipitochalara longipes BDJ]|nr:hypothetical protein N431DRAFT_338685 [Stipitochalara longipes BDJ]